MRNRRLVFNIFTCMAMLVLFLILTSDKFDIREVEITGIELLTDTYIREAAGVGDKTNIFAFNSRKAVRTLRTNTYIENAAIKKDYPDKLVIAVNERKLSGYIEYMGAYLYLDENGRVLEVSTSLSEKLPVVIGLEFTGFSVGEKLPVKNAEAFDTMVTLAQLINKYELEGDVIKVDVSKESDIHIYIKSLDVVFGDITDADEKLGALVAMMDKLPEGGDTPGFLELNNIKNSPAVFRFLS